MADRWKKRWVLNSRTEPDKKYIVSQDAQQRFGCSCPRWKFQRGERRDCHHIKAVKQNYFRNIMAVAIGGGVIELYQDWYEYEIKGYEGK